MKKTLLCLILAIVVAVALVVLWAKNAGPPGSNDESKQPEVALTTEMAKELGAAASVPADVSTFSNAYRVAAQWQSIWESNAVQNLVALPIVQRFWSQAKRDPMFRQLMGELDTNPFFVQGRPVAQDALSSEIFACTGADLCGFVTAAQTVANRLQLLNMPNEGQHVDGPDPKDIASVIDIVLSNEAQLRVPSVLIGCRLSDKPRAQAFLDAWVPKIAPILIFDSKTGPRSAGQLDKKVINGASFYVLEFSGDRIPPEGFAAVRGHLLGIRIPAAKVNSLISFIKSQHVVLATGILGDYLILSIGKDASLLARWGQGAPLAASAELDPLRKHLKPGLSSVSYCSAELMGLFGWTGADVKRIAEVLAKAVPGDDASRALKERLKKDGSLLAQDLDALMPKPQSQLRFSFTNKGIESYSYGTSGQYDCSQPLSILEHRGKAPILCMASRGVKNPQVYDLAVKWATIGFGYFKDFGVPQLDPQDRKGYERVMRVVLPFLASADKTTRECLIPAIDGTQSMFMADGSGSITKDPDGRRLPAVLSTPRFAMAIELNDPAKFMQAVKQYADAARAALEAAKRAEMPVPPDLKLPDPDSKDLAGGKLYFYKLPVDLGSDVFPCAWLKDRLLVLSTSSRLTGDMNEKASMPACPVTGPPHAAGSVVRFDGPECWKLLRGLSNFVFAASAASGGEEEAGQIAFVRIHIDALWRSLHAIRSYTSSTTVENGRTVTHSWLHVEDITR